MRKRKEKILNFLDEIYCINLKEQNNRWQGMKKEFRKIRVSSRITKVNGVLTPENGHIGCMMSHKKILIKAEKRRAKNILIFEDDIKIIDPKKFINQIISCKNENYDVVYFQGIFSNPRTSFEKNSTNFWRIKKGVYGASALLIRKKMFKIIIKKIEEIETRVMNGEATFDAIYARDLQAKYKFLLVKKIYLKNIYDISGTENYKKGYIFNFLNDVGFTLGPIKMLYPLKFLLFCISVFYFRSMRFFIKRKRQGL